MIYKIQTRRRRERDAGEGVDKRSQQYNSLDNSIEQRFNYVIRNKHDVTKNTIITNSYNVFLKIILDVLCQTCSHID